jgi:hypothetical protein
LRNELDRLLRDTTLTTLAFAIGLGWSLFQVVEGLGGLITGALTNSGGESPFYPLLGWTWGGHIFDFQPLLSGLIEFAVVLGVVLLVRRRVRST